MTIDPKALLSTVPGGLRDALVHSYQEVAANYTEHRWEPSELNGGKFCEVAYCIVRGQIDGVFPATASKPRDLLKACRDLEQLPADSNRVGDRSLRVLIPRTLPVLYEIRNNRGVGHVGGDVDPNFLDATAVFSMASWVLAELVRIFHDTSTEAAQQIVDVLVERKHPLIWDIEGVKRVLDPAMPKKDQALLLLHSSASWIPEDDLCAWVEYSSTSMFKKRILEPLHVRRLVEHDARNSRVKISPLGTKDVETRILKSRSA